MLDHDRSTGVCSDSHRYSGSPLLPGYTRILDTSGAPGMVKFLYGKSRATYEGTTIIQESKVVVLEVCGSDIVRRSLFKSALLDGPDHHEGVLNRRGKFICFIHELVKQFNRRRPVCQVAICFPFSTFDKAFLAFAHLARFGYLALIFV